LQRAFSAYRDACKNSKRLLCGLFFDRIRKITEADIAMAVKTERRKHNRRKSHGESGAIRTVNIGGKGDQAPEVAVCCKTVPRGKEKSTFAWYEEFVIEWSETFISKK
jgi:hypothetical protein